MTRKYKSARYGKYKANGKIGPFTRPVKKVKTIEDKLTQRHIDAIIDAAKGIYGPLVRLCIEARRALSKCVEAINMGVKGWGAKTAEYYSELYDYLVKHIKSVDALEALQQQLILEDI